MKKTWKWIRRWGWFLLVSLGAIAGAAAALLLRQPPPTEKLEKEFRAIEAAKKTAELEVEKGHELAVAKLEMEHADTIDELDEKQRAKAEKLKKDPEALARWLVKLGG